MAEEKTEEATPKKRRDQRKEGNVALSKEVIGVASLLAGFYGLKALLPSIYKAIRESMISFITMTSEGVDLSSMGKLREIGMRAVMVVAECVLPIGFIMIVIAVISTGVQTRFIYTKKATKFKMSNLSPIKGIKKLFSVKNLLELLKSILKIIVLTVVIYQILKGEIRTVAQMLDMNPMTSAVYVLQEVMSMVLKIGMIFVAIAGFDLFYQRWSFRKQIRMTKQEVKDENKQLEGNPEIKGRIRSIQRSMARSRMMQAVPDADVIIRNPTHYAVALKYDIDHDNAPILIAKGQDHLAFRIIEIGEQNGVAIVENRPLARGIYASTPLNSEIPAEYYGVVAEILVQVFRMNKKME